MNHCKIIAVVNQKGGVGKTTTTMNLGVGLARLGKKVLLVDCDPQGDLTVCCGYQENDMIENTLSTVMERIVNEQSVNLSEFILHQAEGVDLIPSNIELSTMDLKLVSMFNRERVMATFLNTVRDDYDYIILDCMPSLGLVTVNALAAADSVIIPVQSHYLPLKGMTQLTSTIAKVRNTMNPKLKIDGAVLTLVAENTNLANTTAATLRSNFGDRMKIYKTHIPMAIKAAETSIAGKSIYQYDKNSKVAKAYESFTKEVFEDGEKQRIQDESSVGR